MRISLRLPYTQLGSISSLCALQFWEILGRETQRKGAGTAAEKSNI